MQNKKKKDDIYVIDKERILEVKVIASSVDGVGIAAEAYATQQNILNIHEMGREINNKFSLWAACFSGCWRQLVPAAAQ